jgi:TolB-like protein/DNA-binding winged helix-turn-helix (wHTH) protein/Tfp pilus assembly protein PilF
MGSSDKSFEFGPFRLEAADCRLLRDGRPVALEPQVYRTLLALVQNSRRLSKKEWLIEEIWGETHVEEGGLARNISVLRKVLGDGYIETVPKRGYRFVHAVSEVPQSDPKAVVVNGRSGDSGRRRRRWWIPATVLAVILLVTFAALFGTSRTSPPVIRSIAVLPFKPVVTDIRDEALELGIADSLITRLSVLKDVVLRPTSSIRKYGGLEQDPLAAGSELHVDAVLDGTILNTGGRVRITVRLLEVSSGVSLWSGQFDEPSADFLTAQNAIADGVIGALALRLSGAERVLLTKRQTVHPDAYQLYLRGRYHWNQRSEAGLRKATEYFAQAIATDPGYARAYSGLADAYTALGYLSYLRPSDAFPKAKQAALRALDLDGTLPEPHASLGYVRLYYDWDWLDADKELRRSIALNPNYPTAHHWHAVYLTAMGQFDGARAAIARAQELDPTSLSINTDLGFVLYYSRQYDAAIKQLATVLDMNREFPLAQLWLGRAYQEKAMYGEAIAAFRRTETALRGWPVALAAIGHVQGVSGRRGDARQTLDELRRLGRERYVTPYGVALIHAGLGERQQAVAWLERALHDRAHWLVWLKLDPRFDPLRTDPGFAEILRRITPQ